MNFMNKENINIYYIWTIFGELILEIKTKAKVWLVYENIDWNLFIKI